MASVRSELTSGDLAVRGQLDTAEAAMRKFIAEAESRFGQLDGAKSIEIRSLSPDHIPNVKIRIKDIRALWSKIAFVVTDKTYPPGYGGSFDYGSATSHIRYDTVNGWNAHSGGLPLIVLHELLHSTKQGAKVWKAQWRAYGKDCRKRGVSDPKGDHYWKSSFFSEVEEFCYHGSRELADALGLPAYGGPAFEHGYDYGDLGR